MNVTNVIVNVVDVSVMVEVPKGMYSGRHLHFVSDDAVVGSIINVNLQIAY
jgi:hypothetical protein